MLTWLLQRDGRLRKDERFSRNGHHLALFIVWVAFGTGDSTLWKHCFFSGGTANIQNGRDIVWVSFVQLYLDWMMTTQHMGVLNLNRQWIDTGASLGRMPEQYRFRLRAKWWRLCMQQFGKTPELPLGRERVDPNLELCKSF